MAKRVTAAVLVLTVFTAAPAAQAELVLTAEAFDTPGLPGFQTYTLTASASDGYVAAFDFVGKGQRGVFGPVRQSVSLGQPVLFGDDPTPSPVSTYDPHQDTRFLVEEAAGLHMLAGESDESLQAVYALIGHEPRLDFKHMEFAQIVTSEPEAVRLNGGFVVWTPWGPSGGTQVAVDVMLADIALGPAPDLATPAPPPPPPTPEPDPVVVEPVVEEPAPEARPATEPESARAPDQDDADESRDPTPPSAEPDAPRTPGSAPIQFRPVEGPDPIAVDVTGVERYLAIDVWDCADPLIDRAVADYLAYDGRIDTHSGEGQTVPIHGVANGSYGPVLFDRVAVPEPATIGVAALAAACVSAGRRRLTR